MLIVNAVGHTSFTIKGVTYYIDNENTQKDDLLGSIKALVCHWTAGTLSQFYNGYHFNIGMIGNEVIVLKTLGLTQKGQHVWGRNTGMVGIALCAMKDWVIEPTIYQLDTMAILLAELSAWKQLNPESKITLPKKQVQGATLVTLDTSRNFNIIADHKEFAEADGYGSERQDIKQYMIPVRNKAIRYFKELKSGTRKFLFLDLIKE